MKPEVKMGPVIIDSPHFRPGTETQMKDYVFDMKVQGKPSAAMGDMICWMPAIEYVATNYNYIAGHVIVPQYFLDVASNILRPFDNWRVHATLPERLAEGTGLKLPYDHPVNATGCHLVDLGFHYFAGTSPIPAGWQRYSTLNLDEVDVGKKLEGIGAYVVMTPGASSETRAMLPSVFNAITAYLKSIGVTPVFLGRPGFDKKVRNISFDARYDLTQGLNLLGKTTLLQAAKIMKHAKMVLGIDNGLLHLAGMTDATILQGFTMVGPKHRRIYRTYGRTVELYADKKDVPCLFCQEHIRFFIEHNFNNCIYKEAEPLCVKALNAPTWIANIDAILKEQSEEAFNF